MNSSRTKNEIRLIAEIKFALYQGTPLAVPQTAVNQRGFSP
jgi:hypothetical protein